jgi:hypothetical protein
MALMLRKYQTRVEVVNTVCENIEVFINRTTVDTYAGKQLS